MKKNLVIIASKTRDGSIKLQTYGYDFSYQALEFAKNHIAACCREKVPVMHVVVMFEDGKHWKWDSMDRNYNSHFLDPPDITEKITES